MSTPYSSPIPENRPDLAPVTDADGPQEGDVVELPEYEDGWEGH
ncbi:hypothetical protein [Microbispora sp. NPDC049633]